MAAVCITIGPTGSCGAGRGAFRGSLGAGVEIAPARLAEQEQLAAALGEPTPPAPWRPHAGHVAASEAAAQVAGGDVDEQLAAIRAGDHSWLEKIRERSIVDEIKKVRGVRVSGPPRFRAS